MYAPAQEDGPALPRSVFCSVPRWFSSVCRAAGFRSRFRSGALLASVKDPPSSLALAAVQMRVNGQ